MTDDADFANRLKRFREDRGLSQQELAHSLGISQRTYSDHENGISAPKAPQLRRLAELGCDVIWLLTGNASGTQHTPSQSEAAAPVTIDDRAYRQLYFEISKVYGEEGVKLDPANMGLLVSQKYQEIAAAVDGPDDWPGALKMLLAAIRRELKQAAGTVSSKRLA